VWRHAGILFGLGQGGESARAETTSSTPPARRYLGSIRAPRFAAGSGAYRIALGAVDAALVLVHSSGSRRGVMAKHESNS
jgi:hypothetical protein